MTTTATRSSQGAHARQVTHPPFHPARQTTAGLSAMIRLVLTRNWLRLLVWVAVIAGLIAFVGVYYQSTFTTMKALEDFAHIGAQPSMMALTGAVYPEAAAGSLGGAVVLKIWMTAAVTLAIGMVFLVTRNGRADEELGRTELLRSRVLGLHAYSVATYLVATALLIVIGSVTALACMATVSSGVVPVALGVPAGHVPVMGSIVMGASIAAVGFMGVGVAAVANQLTMTSRGANALGAVVIGVFYVLRMYGDLNSSPIIWVSPIGWGERMGSFGANSWGPFIPLVALGAVLIAVALRLEARRDLDSGLLPDRPGKARASALLGTPAGLALRLQRGSIIGWSVTVMLAAAMFGTIVPSMSDLLKDAGDNPSLQAMLRGAGGGAMTTRLVSMLAMFLAMIVTAFALQSTMQLRSEEAQGTLEPQLSKALGRVRWAVSRLVIPVIGSGLLLFAAGAIMGAGYGSALTPADSSQAMTLAGAALAYWPAVLLLVGIGVALFGWFPRLATPVTWGLLGFMLILTLAGEMLRLPDWFINAMPFHATPYMPQEPMAWGPVLLMGAIAIVLFALGLTGWRRRDLMSA